MLDLPILNRLKAQFPCCPFLPLFHSASGCLGSDVSRLVFSALRCTLLLPFNRRTPDRGQRMARPTLRRCLYVAAADMVHPTDSIEAGWLVVDAIYYYLAQQSPRGYMLQSVKRVLVVNHLIRMPSLSKGFEPALAGAQGAYKAGRLIISYKNPLQLLSDREYYRLECGEQHGGNLAAVLQRVCVD